MDNVVTLRNAKKINPDFDFRALRKELGLNRAQAAIAMDVSPATIENWEQNPASGPNEVIATNKLQAFIRENGDDVTIGKNLLFGHYPLRIARELLEVSIDEIAQHYGYKKSAWQRFEGNSRPLGQEILRKIEDDVREYFGRLCGS